MPNHVKRLKLWISVNSNKYSRKSSQFYVSHTMLH